MLYRFLAACCVVALATGAAHGQVGGGGQVAIRPATTGPTLVTLPVPNPSAANITFQSFSPPGTPGTGFMQPSVPPALQVSRINMAPMQGNVPLGAVPVTPSGPVAPMQANPSILAAGEKAEITERGLEGISLQIKAPSDKAVNLDGMPGGAVAMFAGQLKHSGAIVATGISRQGSRITLSSGTVSP